MRWADLGARERDLLMAATLVGRPDGPTLPDEASGAAGARAAEAGEPLPYAREMGAAWQVVERLNDRLLPDGTRVTLAALDYAPAARAWHAAFHAIAGEAATGCARPPCLSWTTTWTRCRTCRSRPL